MKTSLSVLLSAGLLAGALAAEPAEPRRLSNRFRVSAGAILDIKGSVDETFRRYYEAVGHHHRQAHAESYDLDDFGVDAPYSAYGIEYEHQWRYVTFRWDMSLFQLSADAVANRDYYIGLTDDINYGGIDYDHLKISSGLDFSLDFTGGLADLLFSITPFHFQLGDYVQIVPSLDLGVAAIAGEYEIDAGLSTGTTVYQDPPVPYVVGGNCSGFVGVGAPMAGLGLELTIGPDDGVRWVSRANFDMFVYQGDSGLFTSADHREKELDITFFSVIAETGFLVPVSNGTDFTLGARFQLLSLEGDIDSKETDPAVLLQTKEMYDKSVDFSMAAAAIYIGLAF